MDGNRLCGEKTGRDALPDLVPRDFSRLPVFSEDQECSSYERPSDPSRRRSDSSEML